MNVAYPAAGCSLNYRDEFQLLIAVILSAQCTDAKVNAVLPALFARYPTATKLGEARPEDVALIIRSLGLFRGKARHIVAAARGLTEGVEWNLKGLMRLPGVGRKTANVVLSEARGIDEGIAVDTHCGRLARRLGLTRFEDPRRVEEDLLRLVARRDRGKVTHLFIAHGRAVCGARSPRCSACVLNNLCPSASLFVVSTAIGRSAAIGLDKRRRRRQNSGEGVRRR